MQEEFDFTIESIRKYGGFYIGRYETGNLSSKTPVVQRMNTDISNQSWYTEYSKANNIYDMAGNVWDWTLESNDYADHKYRGGDYYFSGSDFPTSYRNNYVPLVSDTQVEFRAYLYIK